MYTAIVFVILSGCVFASQYTKEVLVLVTYELKCTL